ncbi:unnamed protein product [Lampetra planeri]
MSAKTAAAASSNSALPGVRVLEAGVGGKRSVGHHREVLHRRQLLVLYSRARPTGASDPGSHSLASEPHRAPVPTRTAGLGVSWH